MVINTLPFLLQIVKSFEAATLSLWVFGGWAEELWQITPSRTHNDIDFLYPGASFEALDHYIALTDKFQEIQSKRFSHKRAIVYQHVMVEFLLVERTGDNYFTNFFSGRYYLEWPGDLLGYKVKTPAYDVRIASRQALILYRECHKQVALAYQDFLQ